MIRLVKSWYNVIRLRPVSGDDGVNIRPLDPAPQVRHQQVRVVFEDRALRKHMSCIRDPFRQDVSRAVGLESAGVRDVRVAIRTGTKARFSSIPIMTNG